MRRPDRSSTPRNPASGNMCSKCARSQAAQQPAPPKAAQPVELATETETTPVEAASPFEPVTEAAAPAAPVPPPNPGRCYSCSKKTGLLGFSCRCGFSFCSSHRYADAHACSFDYKGAAATLLTKANPLVAGSKINKVRRSPECSSRHQACPLPPASPYPVRLPRPADLDGLPAVRSAGPPRWRSCAVGRSGATPCRPSPPRAPGWLARCRSMYNVVGPGGQWVGWARRGSCTEQRASSLSRRRE